MRPKENLWRAITRQGPDYVPVRRLDGRIPGLHRMQYRGSRPVVEGETDRWGVVWSPGVPGGQEWEPEIQGYPIHHPLEDLDDLDRYSFPNSSDSALTDGLLGGVERNETVLSFWARGADSFWRRIH